MPSRQQEICEEYSRKLRVPSYRIHFTNNKADIPADARLLTSEYIDSVQTTLHFWIERDWIPGWAKD